MSPPRKKLSQVLREVDPHLRVVEAHPWSHHHQDQHLATFEVQRKPMSEEDWDKSAGVVCSRCGREVFKSHDGLCIGCWEKKWEEEQPVEVRAPDWLPSLIPIETIMQIARKPGSKEGDDGKDRALPDAA